MTILKYKINYTTESELLAWINDCQNNPGFRASIMGEGPPTRLSDNRLERTISFTSRSSEDDAVAEIEKRLRRNSLDFVRVKGEV